MNKEMMSRRAFAGLAAGGVASTLAACNNDVIQAFLNPDSVLGGTDQTNPQNGDQGGDTSKSNLTKLEEIPDNPTLTGDLAKIITGVWCVDYGVGIKGGKMDGKTFDHSGMLNQGYNDGTVLNYSFKADGTFYMHNFKGVKTDGKWTVKGDNTIQCDYKDDDSASMIFDKDDNNYLKFSDTKNEITFTFKKLSDNPDNTSQIAYLDGKVVNFAATVPGTYYLFGLHYADGSKDDLTSDQIESMNKGSGAGYTFSAHKDGNAALFYPDGSVIPIQIVAEQPSSDGLSFPILAMGISATEELSKSILYTTEDNKKLVCIDVPKYTLKFARLNHREDDWSKYEYAPKAQFPWQPDGKGGFKLVTPTSGSGDGSSGNGDSSSGNGDSGNGGSGKK
ncbi:hypothetical protein [Lancefieldella parvula]|uniref:hypothetical protein n=1 Tax=Lancefieldella parvula TaxID=1382 RepID=UPI00291091F0|nr:hypothetical protein [Lancefieldella parvula]MDU4867980.1 hypothetical protein [Lancefieldella parvula]